MRENIETMASRGLKAIEKDGLKNDINVKEITQLRNEFLSSNNIDDGLIKVIAKAYYMGVFVGMSDQKGIYNG